jgi:ribonuclease J
MSSLKFIAISGTTGVTENCYVYEYDNDMIIVDCGVGFPEPEMFGVDLVIPDFSYIKQNAHKLRGILISHGHEDHLGALPFLFKEVKAPIYATKLVAGFIQDKFADVGEDVPQVKVMDPERDTVTLGNFKVTPFRVSHSVPDGVGFCIDTPEGKAFHVPDYKFDWTPVDGKPFDISKASMLASTGTLFMASDALGSTNPGYTESEREIETRLEIIFSKAEGAIYFTTISSNISRMQQAINVAKRENRSVCFIGRSIDRKAEIARRLGFLHYPGNMIVTLKQAGRMPRNKIMYIISGSYGQPGSALYRLALGEHQQVHVEQKDVVVFSADPAPPGSKGNVDYLVDNFIEKGIEVHYYDIQEDLHVSGHGSIEDIKMLFAILKPKFAIPIGGTVRHNQAYTNLAQLMKVEKKNVLSLKEGDVVEFKKGTAEIVDHIHLKSVLVDGLGVGDVGNVVLRDRHVLAKDGVAITLIQLDMRENKLISDPEIISRGFVFEQQNKDLLSQAGRHLKAFLDRKVKLEKKMVKDESIDFLEKFFFEKTGRRPMVLPVIVEL